MNQDQNRDDANGAVMGLEDLSQIFAPSWARETPEDGAKRSARFTRSDDGEARERSGRQDRGPRDGRRPPRRDGDGRPQRRAGDDRTRRDDRSFRRDGQNDVVREQRPQPQAPLAIDVRFMPATKALAAIVRRIQASHKAYPIRDVVKLFQNDDSSMAVRIESRSGAETPTQLFQCRVCGMPALSEVEVVDHLFKAHMADYFDIEEIVGDAPSGNFSCVARCGLTGELLGPPNHHSFSYRVQEMLHDRFPGMSEEDYRRKIEMIRDPEVVEQWREASRKRTVFRRKADVEPQTDTGTETQAVVQDSNESTPTAETTPEKKDDRPLLERHEAEIIFRREIMPGLVGSAPHIVCQATSLHNLPNRRLAAELSARFSDEMNPNRRQLFAKQQQDGESQQMQHRNGSLFTAVHAAFHHRGLFFFRAGDDRGQEFVMASAPVVFDITHATPELREIATFVQEHPSCAPKQLLDALNPDNDEEKSKRILSQVKWLVEKGHIIEFFNGSLTPPAAHPIFKVHQPQTTSKKNVASKNSPAAGAPAQAADAPAAAVTDTPAQAADAPAAAVTDAPAQAADAPAAAVTE